MADLNRPGRFVRAHAAQYGLDPTKLGVTRSKRWLNTFTPQLPSSVLFPMPDAPTIPAVTASYKWPGKVLRYKITCPFQRMLVVKHEAQIAWDGQLHVPIRVRWIILQSYEDSDLMPDGCQVRIQFPGAVYHVMARGDRREAIFHDDEDRRMFLGVLGEACGRTGWLCHAYVLMPNHYHLVIETPEPNLVAGMAWMQN